jgi:hypothetical protein
VSHQLPVVSAALHALWLITPDLTAARCLIAIGGSLLPVGLFLFARHFVDEPNAFGAGLLAASHPFLLAYSTVPSEESWMLAGLLFAFHFLLSDRHIAASVALGVAGFTRYEAWAACPVFLLAYILSRGKPPLEILKAAALYCWAPLVWIIYNSGLTPAGTSAVEIGITPWRLVRWAYVGWVTLKFTQLPVLLLALAGAWRLWRERDTLWPTLRMPALFFLLFFLALIFSAHGGPPDPERFVAHREASTPMAAVLVLAALGLGLIPRWRNEAVALGLVLGMAGAYGFARNETTKPEAALSYQLARYLDSALANGGRALILAPPLPPASWQPFLEKAYTTGGEPALAAAGVIVAKARVEPPEFLRTLVHSRLPPGRLIPAPDAAGAGVVAVWSSYVPADTAAGTTLHSLIGDSTPARMLRNGPLSIAIYRIGAPR